MQIKYVDDSHIELEETNLSFVVDFDKEQIDLPTEVRKQALMGPGEYEYSDISLVLLEARAKKKGSANLFKVAMDEVEVLILGSDLAEIEKDMWEELGAVNVLIINAEEGESQTDFAKLISQIDPAVVIALVGKKKVDVAKLTGIESVETNKKFKFSGKDFQEEEPITKLYVLA